MIAEVILDNKSKELDRTFDYNVPEEMKEKIKIGSRILVPFRKDEEIRRRFCYIF